jgi:hypothetical protein
VTNQDSRIIKRYDAKYKNSHPSDNNMLSLAEFYSHLFQGYNYSQIRVKLDHN